jgi:hypothetical protein
MKKIMVIGIFITMCVLMAGCLSTSAEPVKTPISESVPVVVDAPLNVVTPTVSEPASSFIPDNMTVSSSSGAIVK